MPLGAIYDRVLPTVTRATVAHTALYRLTRGLVGHRVPGAPPMLLLEHVGAKSGKRRTTPLLYVDDGDHLVLVASKGGYPKHPSWYHNLRANPDTVVQVGSERRPVRARDARDEERGRLWKKAVAGWPLYDSYQRRAERKIPLVVLERRDG